MKLTRSFPIGRCRQIAVAATLSIALASTEAAQTSDFSAASQEATRNNQTEVGRTYSDAIQEPIFQAIASAMESCNSRPDTVEPAEIVFIVSAEGKVTLILSTPGIEYGACVASKVDLPFSVPRPPSDAWAVGIGVANHNNQSMQAGPPDKPFQIARGQADAYDKAIAPYVAQARATYPAARKRFLAGLPSGHLFSVYIRLFQTDKKTGLKRHEDVFVDVDTIKNGKISGRINNQFNLLSNHRKGERISFPESDVMNWLILRPDGSEEGNAVGKFLDHYKPNSETSTDKRHHCSDGNV